MTYPLVIEDPLADGAGYWSKGHHDPATFLAALNEALSEDGELAYECSGPLESDWSRFVEHSYWRKGQDAYARAEEWAFTVYEYTEPGRGRFPVTVLWMERAAHAKAKEAQQ